MASATGAVYGRSRRPRVERTPASATNPPVGRRRLIGAGLGVLALVLLAVALLLFALLVGSALSEEPAARGADESLGVGLLAAAGGFLAALVGAIVVLVSGRTPGEGASQRSGTRIALGVVGFLLALWVGVGLISWNMGAASGGEAPLGTIVLVLSLLGFLTLFAGGLAAFTVRRGDRLAALVAAIATALYGLAAILANVFGQGF